MNECNAVIDNDKRDDETTDAILAKHSNLVDPEPPGNPLRGS